MKADKEQPADIYNTSTHEDDIVESVTPPTKEPSNYYQILEIPTQSSAEDIHYGYIRAKNAYSPDNPAIYSLMSVDECNKILNQIEEAYFVLSSVQKRKEYDRARGLNQNYIIEDLQYKEKQTTSIFSSSFITSSEQERQDRQDRQDRSTPLQSKITSTPSQHVVSSPERNIPRIIAEQRFNLSFEIDTDFEKEIESNPEFTGEFLKKIRNYKNVSIERMSDLTKISKTYLKNLEEERFENLPASVYLRGFIFQYAKTLRLSPDIVTASYMKRVKEIRG